MSWQLQCTKCGALTSTPPNTRAGGRFAFICRECKAPNAVDLPASALSDDDLNAFAALYDQLTGQGVAWRVTFAPPGGGLTPCRIEVHWPPSPDFPNGQDVDAEAGSLRKLVTELGQALVKTAMKGAGSA